MRLEFLQRTFWAATRQVGVKVPGQGQRNGCHLGVRRATPSGCPHCLSTHLLGPQSAVPDPFLLCLAQFPMPQPVDSWPSSPGALSQLRPREKAGPTRQKATHPSVPPAKTWGLDCRPSCASHSTPSFPAAPPQSLEPLYLLFPTSWVSLLPSSSSSGQNRSLWAMALSVCCCVLTLRGFRKPQNEDGRGGRERDTSSITEQHPPHPVGSQRPGVSRATLGCFQCRGADLPPHTWAAAAVAPSDKAEPASEGPLLLALTPLTQLHTCLTPHVYTIHAHCTHTLYTYHTHTTYHIYPPTHTPHTTCTTHTHQAHTV